MTEQTPSKPWFKKWWGIVLTVLFFPFVVPYLVWTQTKWNKWVKIGITLFCLAFIIHSNTTNTIKTESTNISNTNKKTVDNASDSTTKIESTSQKKVDNIQTNKKMMYLTGVDKDEASETQGEVAVYKINIWEKYGEQGGNRGEVVDTLPHGTEVEILEEKTTDQKYYKVKSESPNVEGWVSELFVTNEKPTKEQLKAVEDAKEREDKIKRQFSVWDGSHHKLNELIKKAMNDPGSYQHVETNYFDMKDHLIVNTTFRGKNAFGALIKNTVKAKVSIDGDDIEIIEQF